MAAKAPDMNLHSTENSYKIAKKDKSPMSEDPIQAMHRQMRSILNKLTPQNFNTLVYEAINLTKGITKKGELEGLVRLIFEKAVDEPGYAKFCRALCQASHLRMFKVALLNCCQREFESNKEVALKEIVVRHDALIEAASENNKKEAMEKKEEALIRHQQRIFGNIRFIGELFCLQMVTSRIMHQCIEILLKDENQVDPVNIECLCRLLFAIGEILDGTKAARATIHANPDFNATKKKVELAKVDDSEIRMDRYLEKANSLANQLNISRLKSMVMDVCELRKNKWMEDKDKEAAEEEEENLQALQE